MGALHIGHSEVYRFTLRRWTAFAAMSQSANGLSGHRLTSFEQYCPSSSSAAWSISPSISLSSPNSNLITGFTGTPVQSHVINRKMPPIFTQPVAAYSHPRAQARGACGRGVPGGTRPLLAPRRWPPWPPPWPTSPPAWAQCAADLRDAIGGGRSGHPHPRILRPHGLHSPRVRDAHCLRQATGERSWTP